MATSLPTATDPIAIGKSVAGKPQLGSFAYNFNTLDKLTELYDIQGLVINSPAVRSDLRLLINTDDEIAQCVETRFDKLVSVDWRLDGGAARMNAFIQAQLTAHYTTIITNAFESRLFGYSVQERIWIKDGAFYLVESLQEKPFEWFAPNRDQKLFYRAAFTLEGVEVDTLFKFLLTVNHPTHKNPRGKALLAYAFWPWFYRNCTWQFWMQFLDRAGTPLLWGQGSDPKAIAEQLILAVQDAVIATTDSTKVQILESSNKGESFDKADDRLIRRIQKIFLGQTLTSDVGTSSKGSMGASNVHNEVRTDKTLSDVELCRPTVQNFINALVYLNFPGQTPPVIVYSVAKDLEIARATRDAALMNTKKVILTEQYFRREYGYQKGDILVDEAFTQPASGNVSGGEVTQDITGTKDATAV